MSEPTVLPAAPVSDPEKSAAPSPVAEPQEAPERREPRPETVALATFADLSSKAQREDDYVFDLTLKDGTSKTVRVHLRAIDGPTYDGLIGKCQPTRDQIARNMNANPDTFEPMLLEAVVTGPALSKEQWAGLRGQEEWSGGEWASLVIRAQSLCMTGLDVPFSKRG